MFNRYNRCCCQNKYNPEIIESLCNDVGTTADYAQDPGNSCSCRRNNMVNTNSCSCGFDEEPVSNMFPSKSMRTTGIVLSFTALSPYLIHVQFSGL